MNQIKLQALDQLPRVRPTCIIIMKIALGCVYRAAGVFVKHVHLFALCYVVTCVQCTSQPHTNNLGRWVLVCLCTGWSSNWQHKYREHVQLSTLELLQFTSQEDSSSPPRVEKSALKGRRRKKVIILLLMLRTLSSSAHTHNHPIGFALRGSLILSGIYSQI